MNDAIIFNPTNEEMTPTVGGKEYPFPCGAKVMLSGPIANHIMNEWGKRGLVTLQYGDDTRTSPGSKMTIEQEKAQAGIARNIEFKEIQVSRYNEDNERRKIEGRGYLTIPPRIKKYAEELGLNILAPYVTANKESSEVAALKAELEKERSLRAAEQQNSNGLAGRMAKLEAMMTKGPGRPPKAAEKEDQP